jgi:hypothetical protein
MRKISTGSLLADRPERVQALIVQGGGGWDETELPQHLLPGHLQVWNYSKNGVFSVKSAYHLAIQRKRATRGSVETSRNCDEHRGWLVLWGAQIPGKVKVHCWRLIEKGLDVGTELSHRKIKDGVASVLAVSSFPISVVSCFDSFTV